MPYPSQIDREQIVATATAMVEAGGTEALTLGKVAKALGVRTPSLYRYVASRAALLQAINLCTLQQLFADFDNALARAPADPAGQLAAVASALRCYAQRHPHRYVQAMTAEVGVTRPDEDILVQMVLPLQAIMAEIAGEPSSLTALRGFLALVHGFIMLEVHDQLQRGGDLSAAFDASIVAYLAGWRSQTAEA